MSNDNAIKFSKFPLFTISSQRKFHTQNEKCNGKKYNTFKTKVLISVYMKINIFFLTSKRNFSASSVAVFFLFKLN